MLPEIAALRLGGAWRAVAPVAGRMEKVEAALHTGERLRAHCV